jgi:hypothetical protein
VKKIVIVGLSLVALVGAGCGGDDEEEPDRPAADLAAQPEPTEPLAETVERFNDAIGTIECEAYASFQLSITRENPEPGAAPSKRECQSFEDPMGQLEGVVLEESAEFGTGGLAEGPRPEGVDAAPGFDNLVVFWMVDSDGQYRMFQFSTNDTDQIGSEPVTDPLPVAEDFVQATRDRDCKAMAPLLNTGSPLYQEAEGDAQAACRLITGGQLFAPAVSETPDPELTSFGGTTDVAFVGVATGDEYFTIVLGTPPAEEAGQEQQDEYRIIDVYANTVTPEDLGPAEEGAPPADDAAEAEVRTAIEQLDEAIRTFNDRAPEDAEDGNLSAVQADAAALRDAFFEFDASLRELELAPDALEALNAALTANGQVIASLDAIREAEDVGEATELVNRVITDFNQRHAATLQRLERAVGGG